MSSDTANHDSNNSHETHNEEPSSAGGKIFVLALLGLIAGSFSYNVLRLNSGSQEVEQQNLALSHVTTNSTLGSESANTQSTAHANINQVAQNLNQKNEFEELNGVYQSLLVDYRRLRRERDDLKARLDHVSLLMEKERIRDEEENQPKN